MNPQMVYDPFTQTWVVPMVQPRMHRAVTRPPFPHGKHVKWTLLTGGMWLLGYGIAYLVHRYGPTKAVTTFQYR